MKLEREHLDLADAMLDLHAEGVLWIRTSDRAVRSVYARMIEAGHVCTVSAGKDRQSPFVSLTAKGVAAARRRSARRRLA